MTNWFISVNGEQKGPYPTDQLRQLVSDGFVPRDSYVWREGMAQWQPLSQVRISDDGPASPSPVMQSRDPVQSQQYSSQLQSNYATDSYSTTTYVKPGYFSFSGRIGRKTFWLSYVVLIWVLLVLAGAPLLYVSLPLISEMSLQDVDVKSLNYAPLIWAGLFFTLVNIVVFIAMLSAYVKRLHDRGRSGWFVLLALIPLVQIWILIEVAFLRGTDGPNDFGPDPLG
jgi:uncharacterized membrane protein YhaH (DUF805 family)